MSLMNLKFPDIFFGEQNSQFDNINRYILLKILMAKTNLVIVFPDFVFVHFSNIHTYIVLLSVNVVICDSMLTLCLRQSL